MDERDENNDAYVGWVLIQLTISSVPSFLLLPWQIHGNVQQRPMKILAQYVLDV